ncbi:MAG: hypothetical protein ACKVOJ_10525 [Sphingomonadaceae bacterium]
MTNSIKLFASASGVAIALIGASPAFAVGTTAGTDIVNTATVNYSVNSVSQTAITAQNTLRVDRRVTVSVVELGNVTTSVTPGQGNVAGTPQAATAFTVSNLSNAPIDIGLTATNFAGGAAPHGGTDVFDPTSPYTFYIESGTVAGFDPTDTLVTYLDQIPADGTRTVYVVTAIPTTVTNGQVAAVHLTGTAREADVAGTQGAVITATGGPNGQLTTETVLFDAAGTAAGDVANDGRSSDDDDYTVQAPVLTVTKLSRIIADPVNLVTAGAPDNVSAVANANAKAIPGAYVEYCITVANAAGGATATNVAISDILSNLALTPVTYVSAFGVYEGGTVASGVCSGGTNTGAFNSTTSTVTGSLGSIAAGTTRAVYFRVTIN